MTGVFYLPCEKHQVEGTNDIRSHLKSCNDTFMPGGRYIGKFAHDRFVVAFYPMLCNGSIFFDPILVSHNCFIFYVIKMNQNNCVLIVIGISFV